MATSSPDPATAPASEESILAPLDETKKKQPQPSTLQAPPPPPSTTPPLTMDEEDDEEEGEGWQTVGGSSSSSSSSSSKEKKLSAASSSSSSIPPAVDQARPDADAAAAHESDSDSDSDDDDSSQDNDDDKPDIQLGFAEPIPAELQGKILFQDPDWHEWDGGKIGGKPLWLNPRDLPSRAMLDCASCQDPLSFILQIYCPLDEPAEAFHRVLYVFACRKPRCTGPGCTKVLRCQLPRENAFYAFEPTTKAAASAAIKRQSAAAKTCDVCGQGADKSCAGCKSVSYCSRVHQKEGWKMGHKSQCQGGAAAGGGSGEKVKEEQREGEEKKEEEKEEKEAAGAAAENGEAGPSAAAEEAAEPSLSLSVFPEYEIVIEEDQHGSDDEEEGTGGMQKKKKQKEEEEAELLRKYKDVVVTETDEDAQLGQKDLDKASGANHAVKDKQSLRFLATIGKEPDQVLRYARWRDDAPLWVSSHDHPTPTTRIPACPHCKGKRVFEFQVMPQLLHYLKVDARALFPSKPGDVCRLGAMDWGTLAVYTCVNSCEGGGEGGYVEEFVWRQKPME